MSRKEMGVEEVAGEGLNIVEKGPRPVEGGCLSHSLFQRRVWMKEGGREAQELSQP